MSAVKPGMSLKKDQMGYSEFYLSSDKTNPSKRLLPQPTNYVERQGAHGRHQAAASHRHDFSLH